MYLHTALAFLLLNLVLQWLKVVGTWHGQRSIPLRKRGEEWTKIPPECYQLYFVRPYYVLKSDHVQDLWLFWTFVVEWWFSEDSMLTFLKNTMYDTIINGECLVIMPLVYIMQSFDFYSFFTFVFWGAKFLWQNFLFFFLLNSTELSFW